MPWNSYVSQEKLSWALYLQLAELLAEKLGDFGNCEYIYIVVGSSLLSSAVISRITASQIRLRHHKSERIWSEIEQQISKPNNCSEILLDNITG